jgi:RNA polymerase sigma factor (sigma-70 family)
MGRKRVNRIATDEDRYKYNKYVAPYHSIIRGTVARLSLKSTDYNDNFQNICIHLLRYIHTLDPENNVKNWVITNTRREIGKIEAALPSYVMARKGEENEFITQHHGYKKRYRPASTKDFVESLDDSIFRTNPSDIDFENGVGEELMSLLQKLMPSTDFSTGTFREVEAAVLNSGDNDIIILFMKYYYGTKVRLIAEELGLTEGDIKNALSRAKTRINKVKKY